MATITPTSQVNAATMAANWSKGVAANSGKWLAKYLAPKAVFNSNPAASQAAWSAGIQTALANNSYATGMANANVTANSQILVTLKTVGGTVGAIPAVATITAGTGFTTVGTASDSSTYNYLVIG